MSPVKAAIEYARRAYHDSTRWYGESPGDDGPTYEDVIDAAISAQDARIAELEAALQEIASLPTRDANGQKDRASIDVLTGGDAIRLARAALSTKEDGK